MIRFILITGLARAIRESPACLRHIFPPRQKCVVVFQHLQRDILVRGHKNDGTLLDSRKFCGGDFRKILRLRFPLRDGLIAAVFGKRLKLCIRHFVLPYPKTIHFYLVHRLLILLAGCKAHFKISAIQPHHCIRIELNRTTRIRQRHLGPGTFSRFVRLTSQCQP